MTALKHIDEALQGFLLVVAHHDLTLIDDEREIIAVLGGALKPVRRPIKRLHEPLRIAPDREREALRRRLAAARRTPEINHEITVLANLEERGGECRRQGEAGKRMKSDRLGRPFPPIQRPALRECCRELAVVIHVDAVLARRRDDKLGQSVGTPANL